jgi:hypothetical protein
MPRWEELYVEFLEMKGRGEVTTIITTTTTAQKLSFMGKLQELVVRLQLTPVLTAAFVHWRS